jgi:MATE family, multidrug efflux pump
VDHAERMRTERIPVLLFKFGLPSVVALLVHALYNIVDRIVVGQGVGPEGLGALALVFPIMLIQFGFCQLLGGGGGALISIRLGEKRPDLAEAILGNVILLTAIVSTTIPILVLSNIDRILGLFGTSDLLLPYAAEYMSIIFLGTPIMMTGFVLSFLVRAEGSPTTSMQMIVIGAVVNIILDPIMVFGFDLGVRGVALATVLAQCCSASWVVYYYLSGRSKIRFHFHLVRLKLSTTRRIMAIGMAPFMMNLAAGIQNGLLNRQLLIYGGDQAVAAIGVIYVVMSVVLLSIFGIADGAQPIIGFNYGARQFDRVRRTLRLAILSATVIVLGAWILIELFPRAVAWPFCSRSPELLDEVASYMRLFMILAPIIGIQIVGARYFQAIGKAAVSIFLAMTRQFIIFLPVLFLLPIWFGLTGVWIAVPVTDLLSAIVTIFWLRHELGLLRKAELREREAI